jgi:signal transduction histidine kinase
LNYLRLRRRRLGATLSKARGQTEGHVGLDGISERIERLGGTFKIESSPGKGSKGKMMIGRAASMMPPFAAVSSKPPYQTSHPKEVLQPPS